MSFKDLINKAKQTQAQEIEPQVKEPEVKAKPKEDVKMVNLGVKIPEPHRRYWASQAKAKGITITSVILEALEARFGSPPDE